MTGVAPTAARTDDERPVLLTGASGFLGAWIVKLAIERGDRVVACDLGDDRQRIDRIAGPDFDDVRLDWRRLDITDIAAVTELVGATRPRAIIHLAALQIPDCARAPHKGALVNVVGHVNIFEAARLAGGLPVVYGSSAAAKPRGPDNAPANLYGVFKKTDEEIARLYWRDHGVPSTGLRPYIVYGVGRDQGETSAITRAMWAAANDQAFEIPFSGRFCYQYAADVAAQFLGCAAAPPQGALLGDLSDDPEPVEAVVEAIRNVVPDARITIADEPRAGPEGGFDLAAVAAIRDRQPATPLRDGVRRTIEAFAREAATASDGTQGLQA